MNYVKLKGEKIIKNSECIKFIRLLNVFIKILRKSDTRPIFCTKKNKLCNKNY